MSTSLQEFAHFCQSMSRKSWARLILLIPLLTYATWVTFEYFRDSERSLDAVIALCERYGRSEQGLRCYEDYLARTLAEGGAAAALGRARQLEQASVIVKTYCHTIVHNLGRIAYQRYGTLRDTLQHGEMLCFAGYYHGAIREDLSKTSDYMASIRAACAYGREQDGSFSFYQCVHGLGHGITVFRRYSVGQALADCDLLSTAWRRESCHGGVFMELIDAKFVHAEQGHSNHPGLSSSHPMNASMQGASEDDGTDFWPCFSVAEVYRLPCFSISTARVLPLHGRDFNRVVAACESLKESRYRMFCFRSYGRDAAGMGLGRALGDVNNLCDAVPEDMRGVCYETAAAVVATHYADPQKADQICRHARTFRSSCVAGAERIAASLMIDQKRR